MARLDEMWGLLGAQAGHARLGESVTGAGFTSLSRVAETGLNLLEAKL